MTKKYEEPFYAGREVTAPYFYDREEEFKELKRKLGSQTPINIALYGKRRYGKSSLIKRLVEGLEKEAIPISIKCELMVPKSPLQFARLLTQELDAWYRKHFIKISLPKKVSKIGVGYQDVTVWVDLARETEDVSKALNAAFNLITIIERKSKKKVVLFLDEFQEIFSFGEDFLWALRGYISKTNASFLVSSSYHRFMEELNEKKKPFFNFFESYHLGGIPPKDSKKYLNARAKQFKIKFKDFALDKIIEFAEGNPYYVQLLAAKFYDVALKMNRRVIDETVFNAGYESIFLTPPAQVLSEFHRLRGKTKDIFITLCLHEGSSPSEIARVVGMPTNNAIQLLRQIEDSYGLVEHKSDGVYRVGDKFLKEWVRRAFQGRHNTMTS